MVLAVSKRLFHSRLGNVQMTCKKSLQSKAERFAPRPGMSEPGARGQRGRRRSPHVFGRHLTLFKAGGGQIMNTTLLHTSPGFSDHPTALGPKRSSEGFSLPLPYLQGGSFEKFHFSFLNLWISASIFLLFFFGFMAV